MVTLNIRRIRALLISVFFLSACTSNQDGLVNRLTESSKLGFRYYKDLNLFARKGEGEVDINGTKPFTYPFYGLLIKENEIITECIYSPSSILFRTYKIKDSYLISTQILSDGELKELYNRNITIISPKSIITYEYLIQDNYEYLHSIRTEDITGLKRLYMNKNDLFYNYTLSCEIDSLNSYFPTFEARN